MKIPQVDRKKLEQAFKDFDKNWRSTNQYQKWEQNRNYLHAVSYKGKLYPPKRLISIATGISTRLFYGGAPANSYLAKFGFKIVPLRPELGSLIESQGPYSKQIGEIESKSTSEFDPRNQKDARQRTLRAVVERRGQAAFRNKLIAAYQGICAISGCNVLSVLEAAHITPYLGPATNDPSNGLLLRADLHILWDVGLIAINPDTRSVWISPDLAGSIYDSLQGEVLQPWPSRDIQPSIEALRAQWDNAQAKG